MPSTVYVLETQSRLHYSLHESTILYYFFKNQIASDTTIVNFPRIPSFAAAILTVIFFSQHVKNISIFFTSNPARQYFSFPLCNSIGVNPQAKRRVRNGRYCT